MITHGNDPGPDALRSLYNAAAAVDVELMVFEHRAIGAADALRAWAAEHGLEVIEEQNTSGGFLVLRVELGSRSMSVFVAPQHGDPTALCDGCGWIKVLCECGAVRP